MKPDRIVIKREEPSDVEGEGPKEVKYVFRKVKQSDVWKMLKRLPILKPIEELSKRHEAAAADKGPKLSNEENIALIMDAQTRMDWILVNNSIHPKFVAESPVEVPDGVLPVGEVDENFRLKLGEELMRKSGYEEFAGGGTDIAPLSVTAGGS